MDTKYFLSAIAAVLLYVGLLSPVQTPADHPEVGSAATPSHQQWDALLQEHVNGAGRVDYKAFLEDKSKLQDYLDHLASNPVQSKWSYTDKLSYWINAYNAYTVKLILDNYPLESITDLDDGKVWDRQWIKLGQKTYSLNDVENSIIRPQFQEPRIHFAVNCAAASCPPLHNRAFVASKLDQQLERMTRAFINDPAYNKLQPDAVQVSKIFDWYGSDFGDLTGFLNEYSTVDIKDGADVDFRPYDWSLNEQ